MLIPRRCGVGWKDRSMMTDHNGAVASKKRPELRLPSQVDPAIAGVDEASGPPSRHNNRRLRLASVNPGGLHPAPTSLDRRGQLAVLLNSADRPGEGR